MVSKKVRKNGYFVHVSPPQSPRISPLFRWSGPETFIGDAVAAADPESCRRLAAARAARYRSRQARQVMPIPVEVPKLLIERMIDAGVITPSQSFDNSAISDAIVALAVERLIDAGKKK